MHKTGFRFLGRPTYMSPDLHFTRDSSFICQLLTAFAEWNFTKARYTLLIKCDLKMHVRNLGYPLPLQIEPKNHLFEPTSQLNGNFNSLYLRNETPYR